VGVPRKHRGEKQSALKLHKIAVNHATFMAIVTQDSTFTGLCVVPKSMFTGGCLVACTRTVNCMRVV
jgi:hypothetical protein